MITIWRAGLDNMSSPSFARYDPANSRGNSFFFCVICVECFDCLENDPSFATMICRIGQFLSKEIRLYRFLSMVLCDKKK